jgi:dTMP kinase
LAGNHIILDRYAASGVVYSAAKGLDSNWCKFCDQGLWKPDLTFYMDISEKEQISRKGFGSEIYENTEF